MGHSYTNLLYHIVFFNQGAATVAVRRHPLRGFVRVLVARG
jgi:hypothetical protein